MDGIDMELFEAAFLEAVRTGEPPELPETEFGYDEFEHGFLVRTTVGAPAVTKTSIWPNALFAGDRRSGRLEWRVPIDDTTTLDIAWFIDRPAPGANLDLEQRVHYWYAPTRDEESGEALKTHLLNQKFAVWLNQEPILDRTKEVLVAGDEGVVAFRDKLFSQMALISDGGEPKGVIRDPDQNQALQLPSTRAVELPERADQATGDFPWLAGQPEEVAEAYRKVVETWRKKGESSP